jgi:hypothetical protein
MIPLRIVTTFGAELAYLSQESSSALYFAEAFGGVEDAKNRQLVVDSIYRLYKSKLLTLMTGVMESRTLYFPNGSTTQNVYSTQILTMETSTITRYGPNGTCIRRGCLSCSLRSSISTRLVTQIGRRLSRCLTEYSKSTVSHGATDP